MDFLFGSSEICCQEGVWWIGGDIDWYETTEGRLEELKEWSEHDYLVPLHWRRWREMLRLVANDSPIPDSLLQS